MSILKTFGSWFRYGGNSLGDQTGPQVSEPSVSLVADTPAVGVDGALQISSVWACVSLLSKLIATLPIMVYETKKGNRDLAREVSLWQ